MLNTWWWIFQYMNDIPTLPLSFHSPLQTVSHTVYILQVTVIVTVHLSKSTEIIMSERYISNAIDANVYHVFFSPAFNLWKALRGKSPKRPFSFINDKICSSQTMISTIVRRVLIVIKGSSFILIS